MGTLVSWRNEEVRDIRKTTQSQEDSPTADAPVHMDGHPLQSTVHRASEATAQ